MVIRYNPRQHTPDLGRLLQSSDVARYVLAAAEEGAEAVRAAVPIESGDLASSVRVEYGGDSGGPKGDRCEAFIVAGDEEADYAVDVNWGTRGRKAQHFMQAAIDAIHEPKAAQ